MAKTLPSNTGSAGSIPGQGAKIPHPLRPKNQNSVVTNSIKIKKKIVHIFKKILKKKDFKRRKEVPGGPVAKTLSAQSRGPRLDPWLGKDPTCCN